MKIHLLKLLSRIGAFVRIPPRRPIPFSDLRRVLVVGFGGIGDMLMLLPALDALQRACPRASIALMGPLHSELFRLWPGASRMAETISFDPFGAHRGPLAKIRLALSQRRRRYDLIFNPSRGVGMIENALIVGLIGAPARIGFAQDGTQAWHTHALPLRMDRPLAEQNLDLLRAAGLDSAPASVSLVIPRSEREAALRRLRDHGMEADDRIVALHPGAKWNARLKAWPLDHYAELVSELVRVDRVRVVLLGDAAERSVYDESLRRVLGHAVVNLAGRTTLGETAALIDAAALFIGNDSGLMHIALALKRPTVAIFGSTSPEQLVAASAERCRIVRHEVPCGPCYHHESFDPVCRFDIQCLRLISVPEVTHAAMSLLGESRPPDREPSRP